MNEMLSSRQAPGYCWGANDLVDTREELVLRMNEHTARYIQASTAKQYTDRQIAVLGECDQLFHDRTSDRLSTGSS